MYVDLWHWHTSIVRTFDVDLRIPMGGFGVGTLLKRPLFFFCVLEGVMGWSRNAAQGWSRDAAILEFEANFVSTPRIPVGWPQIHASDVDVGKCGRL
jgi:hypothetical protein